MTNNTKESSAPSSNFLLELGPLLAFFAMNYAKGIIWATGTLMVAMTIAMAFAWKKDRKIPPMMLVTSLTVLFFGGLTIWFDDPKFIMYKVTLVNFAFAGILIGGVFKGRYFVQVAMGQAMQLTDAGWRTLSLRFGVFFFALGLLNEFVWRNFSEDTWVTFKVFGLMGLTMLFLITQMPLIQKATIHPPEQPREDPPST